LRLEPVTQESFWPTVSLQFQTFDFFLPPNERDALSLCPSTPALGHCPLPRPRLPSQRLKIALIPSERALKTPTKRLLVGPLGPDSNFFSPPKPRPVSQTMILTNPFILLELTIAALSLFVYRLGHVFPFSKGINLLLTHWAPTFCPSPPPPPPTLLCVTV